MFSVLFTSIGRRVELMQAFKTSFQKNQIQARVLGADSNPQLAPATYFADAVFQIPRVSEMGYLEALLEVCRREKVNLLIPFYEPEFLLLDQNRNEFAKIGTLLLLSKKEALRICADKYKTYQFFKGQGIHTPKTRLAEEKPINESLPLFVKPRTGMGSKGAQKVDTPNQLSLLLDQNPELLVQEFISGKEYTLDVLADLNGKVISVVPRERLEVRSGEVVKSRTVKRPDLVNEGQRITESLGAVGPITIQCIDNGNEVYWIEINPRFGGGVPLSIRAGVDYPYLLYQMFCGQTVNPIIGQFEENLTMLRYDQAVYF